MKIEDTIFNADLETIITDLQTTLQQNGSPLLSTIKRTQSDIMIPCPYHKGGMEKRPSMGISKESGVAHCFTCNTVSSLPELISYCLGDHSIGATSGWRWLMRNYGSVHIESRKDIKLDFDRDKKVKQDLTYVSEEELDKYRFYHPYWTKRGITDENLIELFDLGYDKDTQCITFPVRDELGNCLFVARRSVKTKYFNYPQGAEKPLYGLYEYNKVMRQRETENVFADGNKQWGNELIVCESMIDALTAWQYGKPAVALNGLGNDRQFKELSSTTCRKLILATDADEAGMKARARIRKYVKGKIITEYKWDKDKAKDLNDMDKSMFLALKETF